MGPFQTQVFQFSFQFLSYSFEEGFILCSFSLVHANFNPKAAEKNFGKETP